VESKEMYSSGSQANWKTQLRKGFLDLCIVNCLRAREFYGYDLVQVLKRIEGASMREGIIYPVLARLQEDGIVTSETRPSTSGPPRKYYRITKKGLEVLNEMNTHWQRMVSAMSAAINLEREKKDEHGNS
jgi:PadR family transcriptional regulator, regulatory protein PadR